MIAPRITCVTLKNYKSIRSARVSLDPLTILVGRNGAGKSNFVDALWLVSDALQSTLDYALRQRGGIGEVRRVSGGHPTHFGISLQLRLANDRSATYAFRVGAKVDGGFTVQREMAIVGIDGLNDAQFEVENGSIVKSSSHLKLTPQISPDRLLLTAASAIPEFRTLFDALSNMHFYSINPNEIRQPQPHDAGDVLLRSGKNIASLLRRLDKEDPPALERIKEYIRQIVPGLEQIDHVQLGPTETLKFGQRMHRTKKVFPFYAQSMSDGTLRSIGVLAALFQTNARRGPTLIGIEEPESTIHPGAGGVLMDALIEASRRRQVIATTHSPDMIDNANLSIDSIRIVENIDGETVIERVDRAALEAVREKLFTPGELMRQDQISPDMTARIEVETEDLFRE